LRLPTATAIQQPGRKREHVPAIPTPVPADSGYASEDENEEAALEDLTAVLRIDPFERAFATKWLTMLMARSEEMDIDEDVRERIVDDAAFILSSFSESTGQNAEEALTRCFSFPTASGTPIEVTLNDAPLSGTDHTDVGLQSWGASIVLSSMMCTDPERFRLSNNHLSDGAKVIELGAGTGLVSLTLAKLLPEIGVRSASIAATDYHPAVLENCKVNVETNFPSSSHAIPPVDTSILDWSQPPPPLKSTSNLLIASDVVYAPEHAGWLRDCAAHLLAPNGTFWLMVTVRKTGKFEGIPDTVEAAFVDDLCPTDGSGRVFKILERDFVEKRRGIGRGDESGYNLYRIGWI
jgi:hypothetical protein